MKESIKKDIINSIKTELDKLEKMNYADLSDIGNSIGIAVGSVLCDENVEIPYMGFDKEDLISGYEHGFSLKDGTHK